MHLLILTLVAAVVVVAVMLAVSYMRHRNDDYGPVEHMTLDMPANQYECNRETCAHEWKVERTQDVEMVIDYCSYGGPDPVGIVTYTYLYCPKCGAHDVKESSPVPL